MEAHRPGGTVPRASGSYRERKRELARLEAAAAELPLDTIRKLAELAKRRKELPDPDFPPHFAFDLARQFLDDPDYPDHNSLPDHKTVMQIGQDLSRQAEAEAQAEASAVVHRHAVAIVRRILRRPWRIRRILK